MRLASCGRPSAFTRTALLGEDGKPVPVGEPGEICVAGPLLAGGYWNLPDETAETFRDGWMHTGDVAREDEDGFWYIVDRTKDMIVSGGFNVFPREVEDVVAEHPAVAQVGVIGVPHEKFGEAVTAIVVLRDGDTLRYWPEWVIEVECAQARLTMSAAGAPAYDQEFIFCGVSMANVLLVDDEPDFVAAAKWLKTASEHTGRVRI